MTSKVRGRVASRIVSFGTVERSSPFLNDAWHRG